MFKSQLHYIVDIDIKGFFDNVDHGKLLKQMWAMGIQDKSLLSIIGRILKSEIKGIGIPNKGTPQGGIISPLLSNIVLNELDWWLSDQWETFNTRYKYAHNSDRYEATKKSKLKEFFFIRYADDFKILCRDYETAQKIFIATRQWLKDRLGLEISPEKSQITNVRKGKTEFLGISLYVVKKGMKFVTRSNITDKAKETMKKKLKERIKAIQHNTTVSQVNKLNSTILGLHNYYNMATLCSRDFGEINYIVGRSLYNRLERNSKEKPYKSKTYMKFYGNYKGKTTTISGVTIFPIYGCKYQAPMNFTQDMNNYTENGRKLSHDKLQGVINLIKYLLNCKEYDKSVEYNDNRISLMAGQKGKCGITGEYLTVYSMECHHKNPKDFGGTDEYNNLVWLKADIHKLIHASQPDTIEKYLQLLNLDGKVLEKVNSLRKLAGNSEIETAV
jgi:group II intron reverse transcriptase/maturase